MPFISHKRHFLSVVVFKKFSFTSRLRLVRALHILPINNSLYNYRERRKKIAYCSLFYFVPVFCFSFSRCTSNYLQFLVERELFCVLFSVLLEVVLDLAFLVAVFFVLDLVLIFDFSRSFLVEESGFTSFCSYFVSVCARYAIILLPMIRKNFKIR